MEGHLEIVEYLLDNGARVNERDSATWRSALHWACFRYTVWKFKNFSITQILRESNFGDSSSVKSDIFTHLEALNFDFYEFLHFLRAENQINSIQSP